MAYDLNGSNQAISYVLNSNQTSLTQMSVARWVYPDNVSQYKRDFHLGAAYPNWELLMQMDDGWGWVFGARRTVSDGAWSISKPATGAWIHNVVTYDGSSTANDPIIYNNGVSQSITERSSPSGSLVNTSTNFYIGSEANTGQYWDGRIAEFAIWNRILSQDEVTALAKGASPLLFARGLIFYTPLVRGANEMIGGLIGNLANSPSVIEHPTIFRPYPSSVFPRGSSSTNYTRSLSDNISAADQVRRTWATARTLSDLSSVADNARKTSAFSRDLPKSKELGYLTQGSTSDVNIQGGIVGTKFTLSEQARITKYSLTLLTVGAEQIKCAIYDSSLNLVVGSETAITNVDTSSQKTWVTIPALSPVLLSAADYYLVMWGKGDAISLDYYDAGTTNQSFVKTGLTFTNPFPSSITGQTPNDNKYSIYATYNNAEGITVADSLSSTMAGIIAAFLSDAITATDSLKSTTGFGRFQSDVATVADQLSRLFSTIRSNTDLVKVQDSLTAEISGFIYRFLADNITSADSLKRTVSSSRKNADALGVSDTISRSSAFSRTKSDLLGVSDALTYLLSQIIVRALSDAIGVQDTNRRVIQVGRSLADGMNIQDSIKRLYASVRSLSDVASVSEQTSLLIAMFRTLADTSLITDSVSYEIVVPSNSDGGKAPVIESIIVTPFVEGQSSAGVYDDHKAYDTHTPYYAGRSNDIAPTLYK